MAFDLVMDLKRTNEVLTRLSDLLERLVVVAERAVPEVPIVMARASHEEKDFYVNDNEAAVEREKADLHAAVDRLTPEEMDALLAAQDF